MPRRPAQTKKKAALYTSSRGEVDALFPYAQIERLKDSAVSQGYYIDEDYIFVDNGDDSSLQEMLLLANRGEFEALFIDAAAAHARESVTSTVNTKVVFV